MRRETDDATEVIAAALRRRGLAVPASVALDALRPLRPLIAAGIAFGSGILPVPRSAVESLASEPAWDDLAASIARCRDRCPTSEG